MQVSRAELKLAAKGRLRGVQPHPMLMTLVYILIPLAAYTLVGLVTVGASGIAALFSAYFSGNSGHFGEVLISFMQGPAFLALFLTILLGLFTVVFTVGYAWYGMRLARGEVTSYGSLFEGFAHVGKIILTSILTSVFIFLWTMLFYFPGLVAAYRYRMTFLILRDHPEMSALQAITMSKEMMRGKKLELFVMDLSFLGWNILSALTMGIVGLWVMPYQAATEANFYDAINGKFQRTYGAPPVQEF